MIVSDESLHHQNPSATLSPPIHPMQHRHLNHQDLTLAAVDDIIRRGGWRDWVLLRRAAHQDGAVLARIQRICGAADPSQPQEGSQRLSFWRKYAQRLITTVG